MNGEIISADSMQIYKEMNIGSAKIQPEEMKGVPHYLVDEIEPEEEFNVVRFQTMAKNAMKMIYQKGKIPVIVGGTGFYIQALLYDIDFTDTTEDFDYRRELEQLAQEKGNEFLHEMLRKVDPKAAQEIHENNRKRVIRALEYYRDTGKQISKHNEQQRQNVYLEVKSAYISLLNSHDSLDVSKLALQQAKERQYQAFRRYQVGLGDAIEFKDAENSYLNAQLDYYSNLLNYNINAAELERVIGAPIKESEIDL